MSFNRAKTTVVLNQGTRALGVKGSGLKILGFKALGLKLRA